MGLPKLNVTSKMNSKLDNDFINLLWHPKVNVTSKVKANLDTWLRKVNVTSKT